VGARNPTPADYLPNPTNLLATQIPPPTTYFCWVKDSRWLPIFSLRVFLPPRESFSARAQCRGVGRHHHRCCREASPSPQESPLLPTMFDVPLRRPSWYFSTGSAGLTIVHRVARAAPPRRQMVSHDSTTTEDKLRQRRISKWTSSRCGPPDTSLAGAQLLQPQSSRAEDFIHGENRREMIRGIHLSFSTNMYLGSLY
jgi:hypothetical protein